MLNSIEKEKVIEVFGKHYAGKLAERLFERGFTNINGEKYSNTSIIKIVNNDSHSNPEVEIEIIQIAKDEEKQLQKLDRKRKKLISKH